MQANERTFRRSFAEIAIVALVVLFLGYLALSGGEYWVLLAALPLFIFALFYLTSSVRISSDEIATNRLLGVKSLRWSEIGRVSTRGETLRLHSRDEDLVLSLDPQLNDYADLVDMVFSKRPDLLDTNDDQVMSIGWMGILSTLGLAFLVTGLAVFQAWDTGEIDNLSSWIFFVVGLVMIVKWLLSPKSLTLEDKGLTIGYWFKEISYSAADIDHISLEKQRTRSGYTYATQINLVSGKKIKLPAFKQGAHLTYQILKRWHKKAVSF